MAFLEIVENYTPIIINISIIILLLFACFLRKREKESMKDDFFDSPKTLTDLIRIPECDFGQVIDTKNSIVTGKGYGYESWVKKHNLKQIAKTVLFLQQNNINDYNKLVEITNLFAKGICTMERTIHTIDGHLQYITKLSQYITVYERIQKKLLVYTGNDCSEAFFWNHVEDFALLKEAIQFFCKVGISTKSLPCQENLQAAQIALIEQKNDILPSYRMLQDKAQMFYRAKVNLELFFGYGDMAKETKQKIYMMSK